jgi:hypothetical protein
MARRPTDKPSPAGKPLPRWEIVRVRAKGEHFGIVEAADEAAAIKAAAEKFGTDPKRLMAVRRS